MDDLLVARLHDLNEDTLRTRHFVAFRPYPGS
jgi:chloride channel protein, CIC family